MTFYRDQMRLHLKILYEEILMITQCGGLDKILDSFLTRSDKMISGYDIYNLKQCCGAGAAWSRHF